MNSSENVKIAKQLLQSFFGKLCFSETVSTPPVGDIQNSSPFLNLVAIACTSRDITEVKAGLKQIEYLLGRRPGDKAAGMIPIDIDLLKWNDLVIKPEDMEQDYIVCALQSLSGE